MSSSRSLRSPCVLVMLFVSFYLGPRCEKRDAVARSFSRRTDSSSATKSARLYSSRPWRPRACRPFPTPDAPTVARLHALVRFVTSSLICIRYLHMSRIAEQLATLRPPQNSAPQQGNDDISDVEDTDDEFSELLTRIKALTLTDIQKETLKKLIK